MNFGKVVQTDFMIDFDLQMIRMENGKLIDYRHKIISHSSKMFKFEN